MSDASSIPLWINLASSIAAAAWRAVCATNKGTDAQIIILLRNEFSSSGIHDALESLRAFKDEHGGEFPSRFMELKNSDPDRFKELNSARRKVNGYHKKVYFLNKDKILKDSLINSLISKNQFNFIMEVLEPYERAYANNNPNIKIDEAFFHWASKHSK